MTRDLKNDNPGRRLRSRRRLAAAPYGAHASRAYMTYGLMATPMPCAGPAVNLDTLRVLGFTDTSMPKEKDDRCRSKQDVPLRGTALREVIQKLPVAARNAYYQSVAQPQSPGVGPRHLAFVSHGTLKPPEPSLPKASPKPLKKSRRISPMHE